MPSMRAKEGQSTGNQMSAHWPNMANQLSIRDLQSREPGPREKQIKLRRPDEAGGRTKFVGVFDIEDNRAVA
jgi:hypothetical protein